MSDQQNEIVKEILDNENFHNSIEEAYPYQIKLNGDLRKDMKDVSTQYIEFMFKSNPEIQAISKKKKKERTESEQEKLKNFYKLTKKRFNSIMRYSHPRNGKDPVAPLVEKLVDICQILKYLEKDDIEQRIRNMGLDMHIPTLEETDPFYADQDNKDLMIDIFNQADNVQTKVDDINHTINDQIYSTLDTNIIFDSEVNPEGITKQQFRKLVKTRAKQVENPDKFDEYIEKQISKDEANLVSSQVVIEKQKQF
jgi:hypothetical protein